MWAFELTEGKQKPLCLDCGLRYQSEMRNRMNELRKLANYHSAQIDMVTGIQSPKYQVSQPTILQLGYTTLNNISITNSTIGVVYTGSIQQLDVAVGELNEVGRSEIATALKLLTESIVNNTELDEEERNEKLETLALVGSEATLPEVNRRKAPIRALFVDLATWASGVASMAQLWQQYGGYILKLFER